MGLGAADADRNPFTRYASSFLSAPGGRPPEHSIPDGWILQAADAQLGIKGLPQSATGQTALWTGVNGARAMGHHKTGFPGPTLIRLIQQYSILKQFEAAGKRATLLNAYTESYVQRIERKPRLASASTHVQRAAGRPLMGMEDLARGAALYMDITHEILHRLYPEHADGFPVKDARQRGRDAISMMRAGNYDLVLFEYFLSDKAGHDQDWDFAAWCIRTLEAFLEGLVAELNPAEELLLIVSDHGNLEDLSTKSHTANPVPVFAYGRNAERMPERIRNLCDAPRFLYECAGLDLELPADAEAAAAAAPPGS